MSESAPIGESGFARVAAQASGGREEGLLWTRRLLLLGSVVLYAVHFLHLGADFPHNSPWNDWSKYTDEGWYGDGAIRHFILGHWYLPGDFNPAVAMPVWPLLEAVVFASTGVSLVAARALSVLVFGVMLLALYRLLEQRSRPGAPNFSSALPGIAPAMAVFLACANPFLFVFDRLAILEPLVAALGVSALWLASSLAPTSLAPTSLAPTSLVPGAGRVLGRPRLPALGKAVGLGILLALLGLSKPTAVALFPAIFYLLWRVVGGGWRAAGKLAAVAIAVAFTIWLLYFALLLRFDLLEDYRYLFEANAYTGFGLQPLAEVVRNTVWAGRFMGGWIYGLFALAMAVMALRRRRFFREPLVGALLLWVAGYLGLLGYHNNLQPRYYVLLAVPSIALLATALEESLAWAAETASSAMRLGWRTVCAVGLGALAFAGIRQEAGYAEHPEYSYLAAAQAIAVIVRATPNQSPWVLSVSGSDLTLMTGLPSIDDDFGTLDLDQRVRAYRPGWYVAWNEIDDDKMDALRPLYRPVRVAAFPAMDDPDRNLLILYRLDPAGGGPSSRRKRRPLPPDLHTRSGQQPDFPQLRH